MKNKDSSLALTRDLARKYTGKFVAMINGKVIASGKDRADVFNEAERSVPPSVKIGIFYLPTEKDMLTAL